MYISTADFGKLLDPPISSRRVRVLCAEGRLDCFKVGPTWVVNRNSKDPRKLYGMRSRNTAEKRTDGDS